MKLIELKQDQVVASMNNVNAAEERVQRNISKYERIIQNIEQEKKNLIQKLECINEKQSSEDAQWKNYTNEEITKLRK